MADPSYVAMTPYHAVPVTRFRSRMVIPMVAVLAVGYLVMAGVATSPLIRDGRQPAAVIRQSSWTVDGPPVTAGAKLIARVLDQLTHFPGVCMPGATPPSEFQTTQCELFRARLLVEGAVASIPLALVLIAWMIALDLLKSFYRRCRKTVEKGQALYSGTVTKPPEAPNDWFGRLFCLRRIAIELPTRAQTTVYMPLDAPIPLPGETLAVFDGGKAFGAKRQVAILYAPHLAIVGGSR